MKKLYHITLIVFSLLCIIKFSCAFGGQHPNIHIIANNKTLAEITEIVSHQTGYSIALDKAFLSLHVSGDFSETSPERLFLRILKGKNFVVEVDEKSKLLTVVSFDKKDFTGHPESIDSDILDIPISELDTMHEIQLKSNSSDSGDTPIMGTIMTLNELDRIHKDQMMANLNADIGQELILGTNMSLNELNAMHKNLSMHTTPPSDNDLILGTEITLSELNTLHAQ